MNFKNFNTALIIALILTLIGAGLLIAGFVVPPLGIIDSSILVAYGETLTFVGTVLGIKYTTKLKEKLNRLSEEAKD